MCLDKYKLLKNKINIHTTNYWLPLETNKQQIKTNSWFNLTEYKSKTDNSKINANIKLSKDKKLIRSDKIRIYPNKSQQEKLHNWMKYYIIMYNKTLKIFKHARFSKQKITFNWRKIRTNYLKLVKQNLINKSKKECIDSQINSHILDKAIQDACTCYKSCLTNLRNNHIKHFRIRYSKLNKQNKIIKIEKNFISNNTFCARIFKEDFIFENNFRLKNVKKDFTIHYNSKTDEWFLLNPIEEKIKSIHDNKDTVSLDPGIRTFLTGYSNNKCSQIGNNLTHTSGKYIDRIDKIKNTEKACKRNIKKVEKKYNRKLKNTIDDLHWKSIKYLTDNYGNILIGNLSTKSIVNKRNILDKKTKRIALLMRLFNFKQRLAYKCNSKKIGYCEVDEAYTSKTCSNCANYYKELGTNKTYVCTKCNMKLNRDINGARNIMFRYL